MKKLLYNVYTYISDNRYFVIEKKLAALEYKMSKILNPLSWKISGHVTNNDALIINFIKDHGKFRGNLGITIEDIESKEEYTFYLTKGFDENKIRYFLDLPIFENKPLEYFNDNIGSFVNKAMETYNGWTEEDILSLGVKIDLENY